MLEPFKLDFLYHLTMNSEYIPLLPDTIKKLINAIIVDFRVQYGLKDFDYINLFKDIEWKWMGSRGNLTKRISKWYYEHYKAKLLQETSTAIGNIVRDMIVKNQDYHYDFTRTLNWKAGEFGDGDSCFMSGARADIVKSMARDPRFHAVRFFNQVPDDGKNPIDKWGRIRTKYHKEDQLCHIGISRAWLVKDEVTVEINGKNVVSPFYVIFNGYIMSTKSIASILASSFGCTYQAIKVTNNKGLHGGLYLNDDKSYIIGEEAVIKNIERYDFGLPYQNEDSKEKSQVIMKGSQEAKEFEIIKVRPIPQYDFGFADFVAEPIIDDPDDGPMNFMNVRMAELAQEMAQARQWGRH